MIIRAELKLDAATLNALTDEDLRYMEQEVSRRVEEAINELIEPADDGLAGDARVTK